jgi:hypothetical protein
MNDMAKKETTSQCKLNWMPELEPCISTAYGLDLTTRFYIPLGDFV